MLTRGAGASSHRLMPESHGAASLPIIACQSDPATPTAITLAYSRHTPAPSDCAPCRPVRRPARAGGHAGLLLACPTPGADAAGAPAAPQCRLWAWPCSYHAMRCGAAVPRVARRAWPYYCNRPVIVRRAGPSWRLRRCAWPQEAVAGSTALAVASVWLCATLAPVAKLDAWGLNWYQLQEGDLARALAVALAIGWMGGRRGCHLVAPFCERRLTWMGPRGGLQTRTRQFGGRSTLT